MGASTNHSCRMLRIIETWAPTRTIIKNYSLIAINVLSSWMIPTWQIFIFSLDTYTKISDYIKYRFTLLFLIRQILANQHRYCEYLLYVPCVFCILASCWDIKSKIKKPNLILGLLNIWSYFSVLWFFYVENSTFILIEICGHCREFGKYIEVQIKWIHEVFIILANKHSHAIVFPFMFLFFS